jgi:peptide/nickel transport system permease protein
MKHNIRQVFQSGKFLFGFVLFVALLLTTILYPLIFKHPPLQIIAQGTFFPPGIYVNVYDSIGSPKYILNLDTATANRIAGKLSDADRTAIKDWLVADGIPASQIDITDTKSLLDLWASHYDPTKELSGMTQAKLRYYQRLDTSLKGVLSTEGVTIAANNAQTGALEQTNTVAQSDYANVSQVANVRVLPLGTDNFGRDVLTELVKATSV